MGKNELMKRDIKLKRRISNILEERMLKEKVIKRVEKKHAKEEK